MASRVTANGSAADPRDVLHILLTLLESAVQAARSSIASGDDGHPAKCTQTWCPLCAAAAGVAGESHPLIAAIGEHGGALLTLLRSMTGGASGDSDGGPEPAGAAAPPSGGPSRYQHIPVTVRD